MHYVYRAVYTCAIVVCIKLLLTYLNWLTAVRAHSSSYNSLDINIYSKTYSNMSAQTPWTLPTCFTIFNINYRAYTLPCVDSYC